MTFTTPLDVENMIYSSYLRAVNNISETRDQRVRKPELTRQLLDLIGSPDEGQRYILVTGSKGKGSTSRFISSLLGHLGYKVGLFTSPHLVDFKERIRIDGRAIATADFVRLGCEVKAGFERIERGLPRDVYQGPVGITLAIAALYFREQCTDINVIECGRGGSFDDTNVLHNEWAVITPIMAEHIQQLGPNITDITLEKLGIVKQCTKHVYINKQSELVLAHIKSSLAHSNSYFYDESFSANHITLTPQGTACDVTTNRATYRGLTMPLLGEFQAINMSLAVKLCEDVVGAKLDDTLVKQCLAHMQWPGRCEIVSTDPLTIVDGAIHRDSAHHVAQIVGLLQAQHTGKVTAIIGVPDDKDYAGVIEVMSTVAHTVIVTKPDISHLTFPPDALSVAKRYCEDSHEFPLLEDALHFVSNDDAANVLVIVGTQLFIGNAKRLFGQSLLDIGR